MSIRNVKLPAHPVRTGQARRSYPGKEISFILCPLTPPIPLWRDGARSGQHNYDETYGAGTRSLSGVYDKDKIDLLHTIGMAEVYKPLDILWLNRMINHRVFE
jgi:hypothetical protein